MAVKNGWEKLERTKEWVYYKNNNILRSQWIKYRKKATDPEYWYFLNADGVMARGWLWFNGHWYFLDDSGRMATGWKLISGFWYSFNKPHGYLESGWKKVSKTDPNTKKTTHKWYYMDPTYKEMRTGWLDITTDSIGIRYWLDETGAMATGWRFIDGYWYHFKGNGAMEFGWIKLDEKNKKVWYYLDEYGRMVKGEVMDPAHPTVGYYTIDGITYMFDHTSGRYLGKV